MRYVFPISRYVSVVEKAVLSSICLSPEYILVSLGNQCGFFRAKYHLFDAGRRTQRATVPAD